jgi:hypothetical protein
MARIIKNKGASGKRQAAGVADYLNIFDAGLRLCFPSA